LLNGAADADGTVLFVASYGQPSHGTVTCTPTGRCTYTPDSTYTGADAFGYVVSDGSAATAVAATVTFDVDAADVGSLPGATTTTTAVASGGPTTTTAGTGLPATGSNSDRPVNVATALLLIGGMIWLAGRRSIRRT